MDGLLIVDKPDGLTSADVVRQIKRALRVKTGHLGTLDPFATGVLPICIGQGTKLATFLSGADKRYQGTIRLGISTDTGDVTGTPTEQRAVPADLPLSRVAARFLGELKQVPPMYSALKRAGTPLYKLARRGEVVDREPRTIRIDALELEAIAPTLLRFDVACSKGTYIRVLAEDIARELTTVGHLESLRRTVFGRFEIANAASLEQILDTANSAPLIGLRQAVDARELGLDEYAEQRTRQGDESVLARLPDGTPGEIAKLIATDGALVAIVSADEHGHWHYARVFERT